MVFLTSNRGNGCGRSCCITNTFMEKGFMAVKDDFSVGDIFSLLMGVIPVLLEDSRSDFFLFQIPNCL